LSRGDLTDSEWHILNPLLPDRGDRGPPISDKRRMVNGILWVLRNRPALARHARAIRQLELTLHTLEQDRRVGRGIRNPGESWAVARERAIGFAAKVRLIEANDLADRGIEPVIPPRSNRKTPIDYDRQAYKRRNLIERCVNRLKQFRRIATRYEKTARAYLLMLCIAAARLWIKTVNTA